MRKQLQLLGLALVFAGPALHLTAQTINVRFTNDSSYTTTSAYLAPYAGAADGDVWNVYGTSDFLNSEITQTSNSLVDTTNLFTTVYFTELTDENPANFRLGGINGNPNAFFDTYAHRGGGSVMSFTIHGLNAGDTYDLYVYAGRNAGGPESSEFSVGAASPITTTYEFEQGAFVENVNYVKFAGLLANQDGEIVFQSTSGIINGFTIQSAIPEPSSFGALAGLFAIGFAATRRRARA